MDFVLSPFSFRSFDISFRHVTFLSVAHFSLSFSFVFYLFSWGFLHIFVSFHSFSFCRSYFFQRIFSIIRIHFIWFLFLVFSKLFFFVRFEDTITVYLYTDYHDKWMIFFRLLLIARLFFLFFSQHSTKKVKKEKNENNASSLSLIFVERKSFLSCCGWWSDHSMVENVGVITCFFLSFMWFIFLFLFAVVPRKGFALLLFLYFRFSIANTKITPNCC